MNFKIKKFFLFLLLSLTLSTAQSAAKILIARHENWNHPVEGVFKKYGLSLYKVHYSKDGTCPTFYLKFKYSPASNAPHTIDYQKLYSEILKANSYYPYALVDEKDNLKINVGWRDASRKTLDVSINKASTLSICKGNSHAHIDDGADFDKFTINEEMKKHILNSPYKAFLRKKDGGSFIAYLYAENLSNKAGEYIEFKNEKMHKVKVTEKIGNYYLYLYNVDTKAFFPGRVEVFRGNFKNIMNVPGADFFSLPTANKDNSDILLVSQNASSDDSYYEAYGFTDNHLFLKRYLFRTEKKHKQISGIINKTPEQGKFIAYLYPNEKKKLYLSLSNVPGEIELRSR